MDSFLTVAICLIAGLESGNSMSTILSRALVAMLGTLVISLIVGTMAEKMVQENVARREKELRQAGDMPADPK